MLDRILHPAHIVQMKGDTYRLRETKEGRSRWQRQRYKHCGSGFSRVKARKVAHIYFAVDTGADSLNVLVPLWCPFQSYVIVLPKARALQQ